MCGDGLSITFKIRCKRKFLGLMQGTYNSRDAYQDMGGGCDAP